MVLSFHLQYTSALLSPSKIHLSLQAFLKGFPWLRPCDAMHCRIAFHPVMAKHRRPVSPPSSRTSGLIGQSRRGGCPGRRPAAPALPAAPAGRRDPARLPAPMSEAQAPPVPSPAHERCRINSRLKACSCTVVRLPHLVSCSGPYKELVCGNGFQGCSDVASNVMQAALSAGAAMSFEDLE